MFRIKNLSALTFIFLLTLSAQAQFGQNKVQYKVFDWSYLQSKHFDVYFNQGGEFIAQYTALTAESSLVSLEKNIGYKINHRIPIIVFNSHNEFQQNNIIDEYLPEGVGGVTELFKNRIVVPFEGDYKQFKHVIHHELLHAYMNDFYYGGSIQNIISQNIRLQFPLWFSEGMAEYQSLYGMDIDNDMFIRDAVIYEYLPPIEYITGYLAYRGGQSFFAWLADEFGKEKISDLMHQIKAIGDVDEGFEEVYKFTLETLSEKWQKNLKQNYWPDINTRQELTDFAVQITDSRKGDGFYNTAPAISPDGKHIAYISNRDDYFDVFISDVRTGKIVKKLIEGNRTANFEELHLLTPGLCWSPDGKNIAISVKSGSKDAIYVINIESENEYELDIMFDAIFSVSWNPKSTRLAFVGCNAKQSDIWIYNLKTHKTERVTDDLFMDGEPKWSSDGKKIYFSSDRGNYTHLRILNDNFDIDDYPNTPNSLYVYDINEKSLTKFSNNDYANESQLLVNDAGTKGLFISDRNGINNIYLRDFETSIERPITNSLDPINLISLSKDGKRLSFSALYKGGYDIFYIENPFDIDLKMSELPLTNFVEKKFSKFLGDKDSSETLQEEIIAPEISQDSTGTEINLTEEKSDSSEITSSDTVKLYGEDIVIDLNHNKNDTSLISENNIRIKEKSKFRIKDNLNDDGSYKVYKYKIKFSPDIIYSNVSYSSFYGVQGIAQMAFSDILGNHRIYLATSLVLDLKNSDYALAYYYLPKRVDYGFEAFHSARFLLIDNENSLNNLYRYRTYGANIYAAYPFNKFNRIEGALSVNAITKENLDDPHEPAEKLSFVLPIASYIHDNTLWGYTAPIRGSRFNLTLLGTPKIGSNGVQFFSAIGDFRTYFKLIEDYNFVWRLNGGVSLGKNPQRFYIGGTENWINYEIENDVLPIEELGDFAFSMPIMPLRGFNYNTASGSKFLLMNSEFRFPLFKYMVLGPLPLAFQNIQGVLFFDAGTIWTNNKTLQLLTKDNGVLKTKDLMLGMGVGTRLYLLYFPFKFDVAWSYDLDRFSKPKYYISIGADF